MEIYIKLLIIINIYNTKNIMVFLQYFALCTSYPFKNHYVYYMEFKKYTKNTVNHY